MSSQHKTPLLTVSEVFEMVPGDENNATWINPGFVARVAKIVTTKAKGSGKTMHICTLVEPDDSNQCELMMTMFTPTIRFAEGDTIEIFGKGLRRTEYNGAAQATPGRETEIHVVHLAGKAATRPAAPASPRDDSRGGNAPQEPAEGVGPAGRVNGQTVGMAVKEAIAVLTKDQPRDAITSQLVSPAFWAAVHETASDIIRVSRILEAGHLARPVKERAEPVKPAAQAVRRPAPPQEPLDEDVPF